VEKRRSEKCKKREKNQMLAPIKKEETYFDNKKVDKKREAVLSLDSVYTRFIKNARSHFH